MPVLYNEQPLIPVDTVTISEPKEVAADGTNLGGIYTITIKGNLIAEPLQRYRLIN